MKCPDCGGTQIHMYKEIRQLIAEMGFTKEGIQEEINRTIDSMVRDAFNKSIKPAIDDVVSREMRDYKYRSEFNRTVKQAITEVVAQEVCKNFDISIKIREEKNGQMQESQRDSQ